MSIPERILKSFSKKSLNIFSILVLVLIMPLTVFVVRYQQDIRQRASQHTTTAEQVGSDVRAPWNYAASKGKRLPVIATETKKLISQAPYVSASCEKKSVGDADCNNIIDQGDLSFWQIDFEGKTTKFADFNNSGTVDLTDYTIWRSHTNIPTDSLVKKITRNLGLGKFFSYVPWSMLPTAGWKVFAQSTTSGAITGSYVYQGNGTYQIVNQYDNQSYSITNIAASTGQSQATYFTATGQQLVQINDFLSGAPTMVIQAESNTISLSQDPTGAIVQNTQDANGGLLASTVWPNAASFGRNEPPHAATLPTTTGYSTLSIQPNNAGTITQRDAQGKITAIMSMDPQGTVKYENHLTGTTAVGNKNVHLIFLTIPNNLGGNAIYTIYYDQLTSIEQTDGKGNKYIAVPQQDGANPAAFTWKMTKIDPQGNSTESTVLDPMLAIGSLAPPPTDLMSWMGVYKGKRLANPNTPFAQAFAAGSTQTLQTRPADRLNAIDSYNQQFLAQHAVLGASTKAVLGEADTQRAQQAADQAQAAANRAAAANAACGGCAQRDADIAQQKATDAQRYVSSTQTSPSAANTWASMAIQAAQVAQAAASRAEAQYEADLDRKQAEHDAAAQRPQVPQQTVGTGGGAGTTTGGGGGGSGGSGGAGGSGQQGGARSGQTGGGAAGAGQGGAGGGAGGGGQQSAPRQTPREAAAEAVANANRGVQNHNPVLDGYVAGVAARGAGGNKDAVNDAAGMAAVRANGPGGTGGSQYDAAVAIRAADIKAATPGMSNAEALRQAAAEVDGKGNTPEERASNREAARAARDAANQMDVGSLQGIMDMVKEGTVTAGTPTSGVTMNVGNGVSIDIDRGEGNSLSIRQTGDGVVSITQRDAAGNQIGETQTGYIVNGGLGISTANPETSSAADVRNNCVVGNCGSFLAGTLIDTPNGQIAIEKLRVGDKIYSYNEKSNRKEISTIGDTISHEASEYLILNKKIKVTPLHPFFIHTKSGMTQKKAMELEKGDFLVGKNNEKIVVTSIEKVKKKVKVYNLLSVYPNNNFYAEGVLVHNSCGDVGNSMNDGGNLGDGGNVSDGGGNVGDGGSQQDGGDVNKDSNPTTSSDPVGDVSSGNDGTGTGGQSEMSRNMLQKYITRYISLYGLIQ